jgi:hypothetical protein
MFKFIKLLLIYISSITLLAACGPNDKDAKQLGFTSVTEMQEFQALGFKTKKEYENKLALDKRIEEDKLALDKKIEEENASLQQIEILRERLTTKVKSCGWKSPPESGKFFLGMTLLEAQRFGMANSSPLSCSNSTTAGKYNDSFMVVSGKNLYSYQSSDLCTTTVDGNNLKLHFFKLSNDREPLLGNIYNSLDSYQSKFFEDELKPLIKTYSNKFGFNVKETTYCSVESGNGYKNNFEVFIALPSISNSLYFLVQDNAVVQLGGEFMRNVEKIQKQKDEEMERESLNKNASKL